MRKIRIFEHISLDGVIQHDDSDNFAICDHIQRDDEEYRQSALLKRNGQAREIALTAVYLASDASP